MLRQRHRQEPTTGRQYHHQRKMAFPQTSPRCHDVYVYGGRTPSTCLTAPGASVPGTVTGGLAQPRTPRPAWNPAQRNRDAGSCRVSQRICTVTFDRYEAWNKPRAPIRSADPWAKGQPSSLKQGACGVLNDYGPNPYHPSEVATLRLQPRYSLNVSTSTSEYCTASITEPAVKPNASSPVHAIIATHGQQEGH